MKRKQRTAISKAQTISAKHRQCPKCNRKAALKNINDGTWVITTCRWCDYESGFLIGEL